MLRGLAPLSIILICAVRVAISQPDPIDRSEGVLPTPTPAPVPTKIGPTFKRWFDLDTALLQTRYQNIKTNANPAANSSKQQWQVILKGHFQFDDKARYRVNWLVQTGNSFTSGWNNTGLGTGPP